MSLLLFTFFSGKRQQTFVSHITELLLRKHRYLKCGACTKCEHGPLVPEREKDAVVSQAVQPFSGGWNTSAQPLSQEPAWPCTSNLSQAFSKLVWHYLSAVHTESWLPVWQQSFPGAKMYFQAVDVASGGHAKDGCLCSSLFFPWRLTYVTLYWIAAVLWSPSHKQAHTVFRTVHGDYLERNPTSKQFAVCQKRIFVINSKLMVLCWR